MSRTCHVILIVIASSILFLSSVTAQELKFNKKLPKPKCPSPLFDCVGPGPIPDPQPGNPPTPPVAPFYIVVKPRFDISQWQKPFQILGRKSEIRILLDAPPLTNRIKKIFRDYGKNMSNEILYLFPYDFERDGIQYEYIILPGRLFLK